MTAAVATELRPRRRQQRRSPSTDRQARAVLTKLMPALERAVRRWKIGALCSRARIEPRDLLNDLVLAVLKNPAPFASALLEGVDVDALAFTRAKWAALEAFTNRQRCGRGGRELGFDDLAPTGEGEGESPVSWFASDFTDPADVVEAAAWRAAVVPELEQLREAYAEAAAATTRSRSGRFSEYPRCEEGVRTVDVALAILRGERVPQSLRRAPLMQREAFAALLARTSG